ncbi:MAG TPA: glutamate formimidoyltransferase [Myxococcota bacterium]|nr:glutamate formimidoyltransferase [Myxococcota bacterium]
MTRLVECVPNFSEGRNPDVIKAITDAMEAAGAVLLDVDMGAAANRTVVTIAGTPEVVAEAAFMGIKVASQLIDMSKHSGEHPRMGATDVCPIVPISGISMEECAKLATDLGRRVGEELGIPVYLYEHSATSPQRRSLADIRHGEYEALPTKQATKEWAPDFGPTAFNAKSGATVIGAREFLIAYNINLNTKERLLASRMAIRMREGGGPARGSDGERILKADGEVLRVPGALKAIRAVGWVIEEYGIAQVSVNVLNSALAPLHVVYEEAKRQAELLGIAVTGSEIVGLVPKAALVEAGRYYLEKQGLSPAAPEDELIHIAIRSLGLNDIKPFVASEKIVEFKLQASKKTMADWTLQYFVDRVSSDAPAPGGGSVAALAGSLGAALSTMAANLTIRRPELANIKPEMRVLALKAQDLKARLLSCVTEDSEAFDAVMAAFRLPKSTDAEIAARQAAIEKANALAIQVPLKVLRLCDEASILAQQAVVDGYKNSLSDAASGAAMTLAGAEGAALNVMINMPSGELPKELQEIADEAKQTLAQVRTRVQKSLEVAHSQF